MDTITETRTGQKLNFNVSVDPALGGEENMARDVELFHRAALDRVAIARIYSWNEPTVSLGRSQSRSTALIKSCQLPSVQRPTGGGAVLHGHDITIGIATHLSLVCNDSRNMKAIYRALISPLVFAMNDVGIPAILAADLPFSLESRSSADCFLSVSPNDVVHRVSQVKLIGCALRISRDAVLAQCSIPTRAPLEHPSTVFSSPHQFGGIAINQTDLTTALRSQLRQIA